MCKNKVKTFDVEKLEESVLINKSNLLQLHRTYQTRLNSHRQTLWEIQKHFTWWIYVTISILVIIFVSKPLDSTATKILIFVGSGIGIFITILGHIALCREDRNFEIALDIVRKIEEKIFEVTNNSKSEKRKKITRYIFQLIYLLALFGFITLIVCAQHFL